MSAKKQAKEQKRKSKEQLLMEAERARKIQSGREASGRKKKVEKKPTRCDVRACHCVAARTLTYKTGAKQHGRVDDFFPFHTRANAAEMQDKKYGRGMRLHNPGFVKGKLCSWTCTVCGDKKRV